MSRRAPIGVLLAAAVLLPALVPAGARATEFTVNATGDHAADGCDPAPGDCTVRDAIAAANADPGPDTITVPAGTYALSAGALGITAPVTISGPTTAEPTATIDAANKDRLFDVSATAGAVTISHLRVTRGQTNDLLGGSGLIQRGGTVTLDHAVFNALSNNHSGGALLLLSGTLNLTDTEVRDTHAFRGGGLHIAGGTANVDRTLWLDNDGSTGGGGAIYNAGGTLTVTNSTLAANTANSGRGGAIYAESSTALRNVTFEANSASGSGGGGSAVWAAATTTTSNVLFGTSAYQDNCGGSALTERGGSIDTGTSCGLATGASERTVLLGPLVRGGGSARSLLPWSGSAGIDAGDNVQCMPVDQRRSVRPRSAQDPCDVGAVEGSAGTPPPPPLLAGGAQRNTTETSVLLDGTIDRHGLPTTYVVEYGLTTAYGSTSRFGGSVPFGSGSGPQPVSDYVDELMPRTTYHYRFRATSAGGTTTGEDRTFTTLGPPPQVTTRPASGVTATGATLNGTINPSGDETTYWFEYGPTTAYGRSTLPASAGAGSIEQAASAIVSGLDPGTTQHFRLMADHESSGAPVAGEDRTFTTLGPPQVTTRPASGITATGATLNGTINPSGDETTYWFEYGPTTAYGSSTLPASAGAGSIEQAASAVVSGLDPGTTQHFRLVADNESSGAPVAGEDLTFTTATLPEPAPAPILIPTVTVAPLPSAAAQPPPPPAPTPRYGETVVVKPVSGKVLVRRPGSNDFVELDATDGIPDGSTIDAKRGVVELTSVSKTGQRETARFRDGIFTVTQSGATTDLTLTEPLAPCRKAGAAAKQKPKTRKLWGDGRGSFRTVGKYSAATVRGTEWLVQDSCTGTLTRVTQGAVAVRDNAKRKTIVLRAGKRYLARPRR